MFHKTLTKSFARFYRPVIPHRIRGTNHFFSMETSSKTSKKNASSINSITTEILKPLSNEATLHDVGRILGQESLERVRKEYMLLPSSIERRNFLIFLCKNFGQDHARISNQCEAVLNCANSEGEEDKTTLLKMEQRLNKLLNPIYYVFLTQLGILENGVKFLIDMRYNALYEARNKNCSKLEADMLEYFAEHLREILSMWFSVGLLQLHRITWSSPADILEKVARYEAVHTVRSWIDLKHRLGVYRRCYGFFHGSMANEPVILLHVALTKDISDNITDILNYKATVSDDVTEPEEDSNSACAIFYSITSTQKGLQGIELGSYLIQAVVDRLRHEQPQLMTFSSLSPIPGFRKWLLKELNEGSVLQKLKSSDMASLRDAMQHEQQEMPLDEFIKDVLSKGKHLTDPALASKLRDPILSLCAVYLCNVKRRGYAIDPVANFHLKNGATVWRINWLADKSPAGSRQSFTLMVNYRYYLDSMRINSNKYITKQIIPMSECVQKKLFVSPSSHL